MPVIVGTPQRIICQCNKCSKAIEAGKLRVFCFSEALKEQFVPKGNMGYFYICVSCSDQVPDEQRQPVRNDADVTVFLASSYVDHERHTADLLRRDDTLFSVSLETAKVYLMAGGVHMTDFGPAGLLQKVRETAWTRCDPCGEIFLGVRFGRYYPSRPCDELDTVRLRITIRGESSEFLLQGWTTPAGMSQIIAIPKGTFPFEIGGVSLERQASENNTIAYEIEVSM